MFFPGFSKIQKKRRPRQTLFQGSQSRLSKLTKTGRKDNLLIRNQHSWIKLYNMKQLPRILGGFLDRQRNLSADKKRKVRENLRDEIFQTL